MKRTMIVMLALAMLLAWGGMAAAQQDPGNICAFTDLDPGVNGGAPIKAVTYPYLTSSGDWWGGFALANTFNAFIPRTQLCFVASTLSGRQLVARGTDIFPATPATAAGIAANGMYVNLVEMLDQADARWGEALILGVYTNNADVAARLAGFGMIGNQTTGEAQGYEALQNVRADNNAADLDGNNTQDDNAPGRFVNFTYVPGQDNGTWWRGMAIVNNRNVASGNITVRAQYTDGTSDIHNWANPATIPANGMVVGLLETLIPNIQTNKASQITVQGDAALNADRLYGFVMFGNINTGEAQGMLGR